MSSPCLTGHPPPAPNPSRGAFTSSPVTPLCTHVKVLVGQGTRAAAWLKLGDIVGKRNLDVAEPSVLRLQHPMSMEGLGMEPGLGNELELLPLVFRAWKSSKGLKWLPELSRFGAPAGSQPCARAHPCAGEPQLGRIPGAAPEGSSGCSHLHPAAFGFLPQKGWRIHQRLLSVKHERERGKRPVNDLGREEIHIVCRFPPSSFFSSA